MFDRQRPGHQSTVALSGHSDEPILKALIPDQSGIFLIRFCASFFLKKRWRKYAFNAKTTINEPTPNTTISDTDKSITKLLPRLIIAPKPRKPTLLSHSVHAFAVSLTMLSLNVVVKSWRK